MAIRSALKHPILKILGRGLLLLLLLSCCQPARASERELELAARHLDLALDLYRRGRYREARPEAEQALNMIRTVLGPDHPAVAVAGNNLANIFIKLGRYHQAEPILRESLAILEASYGPEDKQVISCLFNLATLSFTLGRYDSAAGLFRRILDYREIMLGPSHPDLAPSLGSLARTYLALGRPEQAEPLFQRALSIREKYFGPDSPAVAGSLNDLAGLYRLRFEDEAAEKLYLRALEIREKALGPDHPEVAATLNDLAILRRLRGRYRRAEELYLRALDIQTKALGPDHPETATALSNLATLRFELGDVDRAERLYTRALALREKTLGPDHPLTAAGLNHLGALHLSRGELERAEELLDRARRIRETALGAKHYTLAETLFNLAALSDRKGDPAGAEACLEQALVILEENFGPDHPDAAAALNNLALLAYRRGDYRKALRLIERALDVRERLLGPGHPLYASALSNQVLFLAASGLYDRAFQVGRRVQEIDRDLIDQVMGFASEETKLNFLSDRGIDLEIFLSLVAGQMKDNPRARRTALDVWLRRKGRLLEARRRFQEALIRSSDRDPEVKELFQRLVRVRENLSRLAFSRPESIPAGMYQRKLEAWQKEKDQLEAALSRLSAGFVRWKNTGRADCRRLARHLPSGRVLLEFARIRWASFQPVEKGELIQPAHYLAFILHSPLESDPEAQPRIGLVDLGPAEAIDRLIAQFKKALDDELDFEGLMVQVLARKLYQSIFAPLRPDLGAAREIIISPDGNLNLIPFQILMSPEGRWLIEDYHFYYLAAGRDLTALDRADRSGSPPLLMGDPRYDLEHAEQKAVSRDSRLPPDNLEEESRRSMEAASELTFSPLPGTREEVLAIASILGRDRVQLHTGAEALEEVLWKAESPKLLHLATHGFFLQDQQVERLEAGRRLNLEQGSVSRRLSSFHNPLVRSGLALAGANQGRRDRAGMEGDGLLTAEKVLNLRLAGTRLVVLSACDTGLGVVRNGQGVYGLRRAFLQAGTRGLIMSLWAVPDLETKELMIQLYRNIKDRNMAIGPALRQAALTQKITVRERYGFPHPRYWGAFVYLGGPDLSLGLD